MRNGSRGDEDVIVGAWTAEERATFLNEEQFNGTSAPFATQPVVETDLWGQLRCCTRRNFRSAVGFVIIIDRVTCLLLLKDISTFRELGLRPPWVAGLVMQSCKFFANTFILKLDVG